MKKLIPLLCTSVIFLSACQNSPQPKHIEEQQKIYILETTRNYSGLVEIYREKLKSNPQDESIRLRLSTLYGLIGDYDSSNYYLTPLLNGNHQQDAVYLLYAKNLIKQDKIEQAHEAINQAMIFNSNNGEIYNILGVVLVRLGHLDTAEIAFNQARTLFYDNQKVINNLAMVNILNKNYRKAYAYLSQLYNKGERSPTVLHNMLYTIVKLDDLEFARKFCIENKLSTQPEILIHELKRIDPKDTVRYRRLSPHPMEIKANYQDDLLTVVQPQTKPANSKTVAVEAPAPANDKAILSTIKPLANGTPPVTKANQVPAVNTIIATRTGEHKNYSRLVFETVAKQQATIKQLDAQKYEITLTNITMTNPLINRLMKQVSINNRDFVAVTVKQQANNTLVIQITTKNVVKVRQQSMAPYDKYQYGLVFDFII